MSRYILVLLMMVSYSVLANNAFEESSFKSLISDRKAIKVGDALTVMIVENTTAETRANSALNNNLGLDARILASSANDSTLVNLGLDRQGGGVSNRKTNVAAQLTAVILSIDKNGNFHIEGDQELNINGEEQKISIKGWVRSEDISSDNVVHSNRMGNARITIMGDGDIADASEPGWFYKLFSFIGLI
ncbi:MAG: flagellar basal body L-ring protein FlgH [Cycloclasticus sp.]